MKTFCLPDLGEGLPEAEVIRWKVKVGDILRVDEPMVEVENAKAVMEIPAPFAGKVLKLYGQAGDVIATGKPLIDIEPLEGSPQSVDDAGTVVGKMVVSNEVLVEQAAPVTRSTAGGTVKATPAVRALAKRLEVDLSLVTPSGKDGMITPADVERAAKVMRDAGPSEPLKGVRRAMAHFMALSHAEVVPTTIMDDVDIDLWAEKSRPTVRLIRAIALACKTEPSLNAWYDGKIMGRRLIPKIDLGLAVDTEEGLFVPVLRDIAGKTTASLQEEIRGVKEKIKNRSIKPEEMRGATFILSNVGTMAGRYASPVILPPTVAILASGRIYSAVVPSSEGPPEVHRILPLSLAFDHRAVTGGEAARFLAAMMADLHQAD